MRDIKEGYYMSENHVFYSDLERFEIINCDDGEKYGMLSNNDIVIDENGNLKLLILNVSKNKFSFWGSNEFIEVPFEYVKKINSRPRTIIIDADEKVITRTRV